MSINLDDMMAAARAVVPKIDPAEAMRLLDSRQAIAVDVRDEAETKATGKVKGAVNAPRGQLEFKADPASQRHDPALAKDKTLLVYCNSGARAALAGKTLKDMGFADVRLLGGFDDWVAAGGPVER
ncbi:MAG: rhodanese-like domain-containing protein [Methyloceanibacter sp.]